MSALISQLNQLFASGRYSDILRISQDNSISPGTSPDGAKIMAAAYFCIGEHQNAYKLLVDLESTFGHAADFLSLFAATSRRIGDFNKADELFKRALEISPGSPQIRNNYANLLIDLNRFDEALKLLDSVLAENPDYTDAISNKNRLSLAISNLDKQPLPSSEPFDFSDPLLLSFADEEVDYSDKRYFPKRVTNRSSNTPLSLSDPSLEGVLSDKIRLAEQALLEKNFNLVLQLCSSLLDESGQNSHVFDILSDAYLNLNQLMQAEVCLLHAVAIGGVL